MTTSRLIFDRAVSLEKATDRDRFEALARVIRDRLTDRWLLTAETYRRAE
jgi:starch phosphorylase